MRAVFYFLLKRPQSYDRLQREVDAATINSTLSSPPRYAECIQMSYLCAWIKEAMRLHPAVGFTMPRIVPEEGMTICNHFLPRGYRIGINGAVVHYDKDIFGQDADQFNPQRWLEGDVKLMEKHMLHFDAGTRTCLGMNVSPVPNRNGPTSCYTCC